MEEQILILQAPPYYCKYKTTSSPLFLCPFSYVLLSAQFLILKYKKKKELYTAMILQYVTYCTDTCYFIKNITQFW